MYENYIAVIQAGGKGSRMRELTGDLIPKPMLPLNGKPMLQWQIENIAAYGIRDFVVIIGHLGNAVKEYFQDGAGFGVRISYIEENEPLGSAGALFYLSGDRVCKDTSNEMQQGIRLNVSNASFEHFLLVFGDVMFDLDWSRMIAFYEGKGAEAVLLAHPNGHPYDSDILLLDTEERVIGIDSKNNVRDYWYNNVVNAGIYILSRKLLNKEPFGGMPVPQKLDLEKDVLANQLASGQIYAYCTPEYVKDAGTPERFRKVAEEQQKGIWEQRCLSNRQKCIFLDRDGTVNQYRGLIATEADLELENTAAEAVRLINESGYLAIVVTNQPVVARGMCEMEDVRRIHRKLQVLLGNEGAYLDDIAFCPHHPDKGYPEENPLYKIKCHCRKPDTGMIEALAEKYNIDLASSYIVGDSTIDIQTGVNAGLKTVLVRTGQAGKDGRYQVEADYEAEHLLGAVRMILRNDKLGNCET